MSDKKTTLAELKQLVNQFTKERNWSQFHGPTNLVMNLGSEVGELLDIFRWIQSKEEALEICNTKKEAINNEVADILWSLLLFCNNANIDLTSALQAKMKKTALKYPVYKSKNKNIKYNEI